VIRTVETVPIIISKGDPRLAGLGRNLRPGTDSQVIILFETPRLPDSYLTSTLNSAAVRASTSYLERIV
jgi:hypothetical protein